MMVGIQFIYIFTFAIVFLLAQVGLIINNRDVASKGKFHWNKYYFLSFLILFLFIGTREGVGRDFYGYIDKYEMKSQLFKFGESDELGYIWLTNALHFFNLDYHSFFLATSFITILLLFNSFKNAYQLLPIGILVFCIGGTYIFIINGVRQGIALMAFYNALRFIDWDVGYKDKLNNFFWFAFYITLGALFHYSILIFTPLILILNKRFLSLFNSWILLVVVISGVFINSVSSLSIFPSTIIEIFPKYAQYADPILNPFYTGHFGFGAVLFLSANLLPVCFYDKIKKEYPSSAKFFVLFSFGIGLYYAFPQYMLITRIIIYLSFCNIIVFAYIYKYFKNQRGKSLIYGFLNIYILLALVIQSFYPFANFMQAQIENNNFSLWFIPLMK